MEIKCPRRLSILFFKMSIISIGLTFLIFHTTSCINVPSGYSSAKPFENNITKVEDLSGEHYCIQDRATGTTKFGDCTPSFDTLNLSILGDTFKLKSSESCKTEIIGKISYDETSNKFNVRDDSGHVVKVYEFRRLKTIVNMQQDFGSFYACGFQCELRPISENTHVCDGK